MALSPVEIRRPCPADWPRILDILESANFHRLGGAEMPEFPLESCFVAVCDGAVVGVAGYRLLAGRAAKTTLLAVDPRHRGGRAGRALQKARQDFLRAQGIKVLYTNVDDERLIHWYGRLFGYRPTGKRIPKVEPFGRPEKSEWINLVVDL